MAGTYETSSKLLKEQLRAVVEQQVENHVVKMLEEAKKDVPQYDNAPYATDALRESGYIASPEESDYEWAINAAQNIRAKRIAAGEAHPRTKPLRPWEILPGVQPEKIDGHVRRYIDFPLSYAFLIHEGAAFLDGRPFLEAPFARESEALLRAIRLYGLHAIKDIHYPTMARETKRTARGQAAELRDTRKKVAANALSFAEVIEVSGEKAERLRDPKTGKIIEQFGEMHDRIVRNAAETSGVVWTGRKKR